MNEIEVPQDSEDPSRKTRPLPFVKDPRYQELLVIYQNGDWDASEALVDALLKDFPGDPSLLEFLQEISIKRVLQTTSEAVDKEDRRAERIQNARRFGIFALIVVALGAILFFALSQFRSQLAANQQAADAEATQAILDAKYENAVSFLQGDRAASALELLREIQAADPDFKDVGALIVQAEDTIAIDKQYQEATLLYNQGNLEEALEIYKRIQAQRSEFRDTLLRITEIEENLEIDRLFGVIQTSYDEQDWDGLIAAYNQIIELDPTTSIEGYEEMLFLAYLNRIIDTAGKPEVTLEETELAEEYYRKALSLLPQNRDFAQEREELQRTASSLIGNKYYLFAMDLLNSEGYSPETMNEVLRLLRLADEIGAGSPVIDAEITRAELFIVGYNYLASGRYGQAIDELEGLYRLDSDYANGMVQYLLYEAYMSRGDLLYTYGDYAEARADYELAETFGWGDFGNTLRLFEVEIRIGFTLRRLFLLNEAAEYYNYAFSLIPFEEKVYESGDDDLIADYEDALAAFARNDEFNAARLFESVLEQVEIAYSFETVQVSRGQSIFEISFAYGSTAQVIRDYNQLGVITVFKADQEIMVPYFPEN